MLEATTLVRQLAAIRDLRRGGAEAAKTDEAMTAWTAARAEWWQGLVALGESGVSVPLVELSGRMQLSDPEVDALLVLLAPQIDPELLDVAIGDTQSFFVRAITVELLLGLLFHTAEARYAGREVLSSSGVLVRRGLVQLVPVGAELSPSAVEVRPSEGLVDLVLDRPLASGPIAQYCELSPASHAWDAVFLPGDDKERVWQIVSGTPLVQAELDGWGYGPIMPRARGVVLLFAGPPGTGKSMFAHGIASRLGRSVLSVFTSRLLARRESIRPVVSEALRIAALANVIVLIDDCESLLGARDERFLALLECLDRHEGILILTTNNAPSIDFAMERRIQFRLDFEPPTAQTREFIWESHLPPGAPLSEDIDILTLAAAYEFTGGKIRNSVLLALADMAHHGADKLTMATLRQAAETQLGARFDDLAVKASTDFGLDRLVLPDDEMAKIQEILQACRHREFVLTSWGFGKSLSTGRGLCILFDGPPGTGKTFSAELLSNELKLPMYRIHIPNIVSKWVGETERNIAEIFKRARSARARIALDGRDRQARHHE